MKCVDVIIKFQLMFMNLYDEVNLFLFRELKNLKKQPSLFENHRTDKIQTTYIINTFQIQKCFVNSFLKRLIIC